jgi:cytochrome c oxidase subunit II
MTSPSSRRVPACGLSLIAVTLALDVWASFAVARLSHSWLPVQASRAAALVDDLFALEAGIGAFIFPGCCGVILWTLLFNRAPKYDLENGAPMSRHRCCRWCRACCPMPPWSGWPTARSAGGR